MIFELLKQLETDVWFCFENFSYGSECLIDVCTKESISLVFKPKFRKYNNALLTHLPALFNDSKNLLRSELRIYFPPKFAKELNVSRKIRLFTESAPKMIKHQLHEFQMNFIDLQGLSKKHSENWKSIINYEFTSGFDNF